MDENTTIKRYIINKIKTCKRELIAILILIFVVLSIFVCVRFFVGDKGKYVKVYVNNKLEKILKLNKDQKYLIETKNGYNLLIIKDRKARVLDSDCPNQICVNKGSISKNDESIICLPHHVVVTIESSEPSKVDAVAN